MFIAEANVKIVEPRCSDMDGLPCLGKSCMHWAWITALPDEHIGFCGKNMGDIAALPKFLELVRPQYVAKNKDLKPPKPSIKHTGILGQKSKVNPEKLAKALEEGKEE